MSEPMFQSLSSTAAACGTSTRLDSLYILTDNKWCTTLFPRRWLNQACDEIFWCFQILRDGVACAFLSLCRPYSDNKCKQTYVA